MRADKSQLRGNLWWNDVKYDVYGKLDAGGRTRSAHAGKSEESRHVPAPRFFKLEMAFGAGGARGRYVVDGQGADCRADFLLARKRPAQTTAFTDPGTNTGMNLVSPEPPAAPATPAVWHTIHDEVFAYAEMGGEGRSLNIPTSVDLELTFRRADWGVFDYKAKDGRRGRGWISLGDVRRAY